VDVSLVGVVVACISGVLEDEVIGVGVLLGTVGVGVGSQVGSSG